MSRTARLVVAGGVVVGLLVVVALMAWPGREHPGRGGIRATRDDSSYAAGPSSPRLVVAPPSWHMHMFAQMSGSLVVNDQHCVTLGDNVVLADHGSRVTPDGRAIVFPGNLVLPLHTGFVGGGGGYGNRRWLEKEARGDWPDDLVDALERCLGDDDASVVQVWLDQAD